MSNQRKGKTYTASGFENGDAMKIVTFFKQAKAELGNAGEVDAAFYFEQVETWLREGNGLPSDERNVAKVLGL